MTRLIVAIAVGALALLAGCVSVSEVKGPDGKPALAVKCADATVCYQKAGELCPNGYDFVNSSTGTVVSGVNGIVTSGNVTTILVECKTPVATTAPQPAPTAAQ